jgi:hypothetical protein
MSTLQRPEQHAMKNLQKGENRSVFISRGRPALAITLSLIDLNPTSPRHPKETVIKSAYHFL